MDHAQTLLDVVAVNFGEAGQVVDQFTDTQDIVVSPDAYRVWFKMVSVSCSMFQLSRQELTSYALQFVMSLRSESGQRDSSSKYRI